ncbi:hypothetical protein JCM17846_29100 [Iodidimonas nitroreducens]|uniref:N-acetyltransferase domain-containing protein n=1 Tax=Iodidimonas nitroreducens TaxID=1236968 RepID=A0A5A7NAU9_9PROT|nr:GNAT family N-acetyltransferase [Iodidimonas nitroreducens]GAK33899.1 putative N-acetyltransferase 8 [alpha proteobacterium Q-1]GER05228.1 hypothetical protein JCM17846_29100 [Iodidimonas nitroreducens]
MRDQPERQGDRPDHQRPDAAMDSASATSSPAFNIRSGRPEDTPQVIGLIGRCFSAYPGCVLDLPGLDADLHHISSLYEQQGGHFWVAETLVAAKQSPHPRQQIIGCVGYTPKADQAIELKRLYVDTSMRRLGLASALLELVMEKARDCGASRMDLWSDTRFIEAHAFYQRHGFIGPGETRDLNDPSNTTEYHFYKNLAPHANTPERAG